jgi:hypothetical protein
MAAGGWAIKVLRVRGDAGLALGWTDDKAGGGLDGEDGTVLGIKDRLTSKEGRE